MISGGTILRWLRNAMNCPKSNRTLAEEVSAVPSAIARISGTLDRLKQEVDSLQDKMDDDSQDPSTSLIGSATRIQTLLDESISQADRRSRSTAASRQLI